MKAIEFPEANIRIAENQPEYETVPANITPDDETKGYFNHVTMCFELDEEERRQVLETGRIWQTILVPSDNKFHPIKMSCLKPEGFKSPEPDQLTNAGIFKHRLKNAKGQTLVPGKIATGRLVDERRYQEIEHYYTQKHGRKPNDIEMFEECLRHEKEWLTSSVLLKAPELISFRAETNTPCEVAVYAELNVLIPDDGR